MANKRVKSDTSKIEDLLKSLNREGGWTLRVGILGATAQATHDKASSKTNAEIGAIHELELGNAPRRSFLEDSLKFRLQGKEDEALFQEIKQSAWSSMFVKRKPKQFLQDMGSICLRIIEEGFATEGFGLWASLSESTRRLWERKNRRKFNATKKYGFLRGAIAREKMREARLALTDTGKLRRSIDFKLIKEQK